ncbi:hypothetical protein VNI00_008038 [Paramarasmius palmivorus]|uniref:Carboxylesterase type B domain-containing protein n=1 Tax=Paramarasmius palmivorus TaxID=297713 RepID=A0AAW0CZQ0_9AGAR
MLFLASLSLSLLAVLSTAADSEEYIVSTAYTSYLGIRNTTYTNSVAFLGVPYAEPPIGALRFRAPKPLNYTRVKEEDAGKVQEVVEYPTFCVQASWGLGDEGGAGTEDCLKVNIWKPVGAKAGDNLPILFYIHGGGYVFGNPEAYPFDHWIHQSPNFVVVSVYYRLAAFGFLPTSDPEDLNAGLLDQIEALRWVKRNIAAWGGDPEKVTIVGESAGGSAVQLLLTASYEENEEPLFRAAIAQSVWRVPVPRVEDQLPLYEFFVGRLGCQVDDTDCLRNATVEDVARAQDAAVLGSFDGPYNTFHPVVDGQVITEYPTKVLLQERAKNVRLIVGATSNETDVYGTNLTETFLRTWPAMGVKDVEDVLALYPEEDFESEDQRFQVATGESLLLCAREIVAENHSNLVPVWAYRYNEPNPTLNTTVVTHAAEIWWMHLGVGGGFNGTVTFTPLTSDQTAFAQELIAYWISFVREGDPNARRLPGSPFWPEYQSSREVEEKKRIVLQKSGDGSHTEDEPWDELERCKVIAGKAEVMQN